LAYLEGQLSIAKEVDRPLRINYRDTIKCVEILCKNLEAIELEISIISAQRLLNALRKKRAGQLYDCLRELQGRVYDQFEKSEVIIIPIRKNHFYTKRELFGAQVETRFPRIIEDIEESGKCLALGRSTATVFHLMRIMEVGVQEFGSLLGVPIPTEKTWQDIMNRVNKAIGLLPENTPQEKKIKSNYGAAASHLSNVKIAWRNEVMHPKATYTEEEAEDIFSHVKAFIRYLATIL
jgi:hypothetical protein